MATIEQLQEQINELKERNLRVDAGKAWETSWSRKFLIAALTYLSISLFFLFASLPNPFINSIVPTLGFLLSTISLGFFKNLWLKFIHKK